jgi:hypothetical protein
MKRKGWTCRAALVKIDGDQEGEKEKMKTADSIDLLMIVIWSLIGSTAMVAVGITIYAWTH